MAAETPSGLRSTTSGRRRDHRPELGVLAVLMENREEESIAGEISGEPVNLNPRVDITAEEDKPEGRLRRLERLPTPETSLLYEDHAGAFLVVGEGENRSRGPEVANEQMDKGGVEQNVVPLIPVDCVPDVAVCCEGLQCGREPPSHRRVSGKQLPPAVAVPATPRCQSGEIDEATRDSRSRSAGS